MLLYERLAEGLEPTAHPFYRMSTTLYATPTIVVVVVVVVVVVSSSSILGSIQLGHVDDNYRHIHRVIAVMVVVIIIVVDENAGATATMWDAS